MKPFSKTLGMTPELLIALKFTCTLRRGVIQEPANIWARGGDCLSAETALKFVCHYAIRISEDAASARACQYGLLRSSPSAYGFIVSSTLPELAVPEWKPAC